MTTPVAQWPQQQPQQPQPSQLYKYAGYQQQYPQQQYPQQQYPQQQYAGQQYAQQQYPQQQYANPQPESYSQAYQPTSATSSSQVQQVPPSSSHTCYNCGSPEHWAQNCPEPRREVPAGALNHQNYPRPLKRQKTNAPIITKYPLPPHVAPPPGPPRAHGPSPYGQPGYAQNQGASVPPTPLSAQSSPPHQWSQPSQYQQYQQQYQQGYSYQQGASYQHQSYAAPTPITPSTYYGSQNQNHPPAQWPQYNAAYNPHAAQYQKPSGVPTQPYSSAPSSVTSPGTSYQWNQHQGLPGVDPAVAHQGSPASNTLVQSQSSTPKPQQPDVTDNEVDEDDLEKLDVPDIPSGGALIDLTGRPLSANFVVAEAIPILPPEPENDGCCRSKYTDRGKPDILGQNVKNTSYWEELSKDPIFSPISDDGVIVPIDYLKSLYDPRQANSEEAQEYGNEDNNSNHSRFEINGEDIGDVMDSLEHALNAGRPKPLEASSRKSSGTIDQTSAPYANSGIPPQRDTEAMLAALGVTGAPKPVRAPARPYPPPPAQELPSQASPNDISSPRSKSPVTFTSIHSTNNDQLPPGLTERSYLQNVEPPPPPPPPAWKPSFHDSTTGSPSSAGPSYGGSNGHSNQSVENGNIYQPYSTDGQSASPIKLRPGGPNSRKRDFDNRDDSSDESETQERRQVDDVTPKLKRRQPKVAEAYSRRW